MASVDVPAVTVPVLSDEQTDTDVVQWEELTDREKAYIATMSDATNDLHSDECMDYILQKLLKTHLEGLLFDAIEVVNQLESLITSGAHSAASTISSSSETPEAIYEPPFEVLNDEEIRLVQEFISAKGTSVDISQAFYTHPLIIDIKQKYEETLVMLDFMQGSVVKSRDIASISISAQSRPVESDGKKSPKKKKKKVKSPKKKKSTFESDVKDEKELGDEWQLISDDGEWKSEFVVNDELNTHSYRVTGIGNVPAFNICALFIELDLLKEWVPLAKETSDLGSLSRYTKTGFCRVGLIWPLSDRETFIYGYGVDDLERNNRLLIFFDSREIELDNDFRQGLEDEIKKKKRSKGLKIDIHIGGFLLEILDESRTKITVVFNCDPKVALPYSVLNWFCGQFIAIFLKKMVDCADFQEGSPFLDRIASKPEFYGHIRDNISAKSPRSPSASLDGKETGTDLTDTSKGDKTEADAEIATDDTAEQMTGFPSIVPES